jgi:type II secretory pathway component PulC
MAQRRGRLELERASALVEVFRTLDDAGALKGLIHPLGPEGALAPSPTEEWDQLVRPADVAGHFVLRRERLAELLEKDLNGLARQARIVPYMEEGRVTGFKLFGIRRASLPYALGLRNGDVVRTLGGMPLDSPDNALAAYAALRDASRTEVELTRRGKPVTFTYTFE